MDEKTAGAIYEAFLKFEKAMRGGATMVECGAAFIASIEANGRAVVGRATLDVIAKALEPALGRSISWDQRDEMRAAHKIISAMLDANSEKENADE